MSKGLKRTAPSAKGSSKKRKVTSKPTGASRSSTKNKTTVPIPADIGNDEDVELSDQDYEIGNSLQAASFLAHLDKTGLARSKKETERLHKLNKPKRTKAHGDDDLPSIDSHSEDDEPWSSALEDDILSDAASDSDSEPSVSDSSSVSNDNFGDSDAEMPYEALPRSRRGEPRDEDKGIARLPIKLASGHIEKSREKVMMNMNTLEDSDSEDYEGDAPMTPDLPARDDVATGARFGRAAVIDVVSKGSRKTRVKAAQEQIASVCQDILADPENSLGLLRRLHTFSLASISTPTNPEPVQNDVVIRRLAILSQLAVFKDLIPGYRIRSLTDKEKSEKVSQAVSRTREWEQGLVGVYQNYLRGCEEELKAKTELADTALRCMCTLLVEVTHFNFRTNILASIIGRLSKKKWDGSSELCLTTLNAVFRADIDGQVSLETVRLLNRMIKERRFAVDPAVLSCLLHLRVHKESHIRVSEQRADKHIPDKRKGKGKSKKDKAGTSTHLSKKTKKMLKERKEIEGEMQEAAAEIDVEEKANAHTETLKLLFVLYFRILKNDRPTPLLSAALQGISRYAHNVNVDFFRDLLMVLKAHVAGTHWKVDPTQDERTYTTATHQVRVRLECIVTAYELLTGQGEALDLDLSDFLHGLYALLPPLSANAFIDQAIINAAGVKGRSTADLLFRALDLSLNVQPRSAAGGAAPAARQAAFARRLLGCALAWPGPVATQAVRFVRGLVARDKRLLALLDGDELAADGMWRPDLDDPDLANALAGPAWEVVILKEKHVDEGVRKAASALLALTRESQ